MASLDSLTQAIATQPDLESSVALLVGALADRIKATSNDQNIQALARDLKSAAPALVSAVVAKERMGA